MLSIYLVSLGGIFPIGGVLQGALGDRIGLGHTTALVCGLMVAVLLYIRAARPHLFTALGDPEPLEVQVSAVEVDESVGLVAEPQSGIS